MEQRQKLPSTFMKDDRQSSKMKRKPMFDETGTQLLNGVKLSFQRGFGFMQNPSLNSPAHCIDDNKIIYLVGKQIIQYDMLTQNQKVIDSIDQDEQITAFIYFKNLMLDDNIIYSVHAMNKTYPSIVAKNYSKGLSQKYVMAHLQKQEKIVQLLLISENKYIIALSQLQGTYRLSYVDVQTKEILASQSIYIRPLGMFIAPCAPKCIIVYTATEIYMVEFTTEIKPVPLGLAKSIHSQSITEAVSSTFTNGDIIVYLITTAGNLMLVNINSTTVKVANIQTVFLGEFQTVNERNQVIKKPRMPSSICCNEYNIIIGYQLVQQFSLVKISPIMTSKPNVQKISFSCPNLHKIISMHFAHQTMSICVIVQVKQNDRHDLTIPITSQYLTQKTQQQTNSKSTLSNHLLPPGKIFPIIFNMLLHDTLVQTLRSPIQSILGWMLFIKQILDVAILPTKKMMLILSREKKLKAVKYEHLNSTSFQRMLMWEVNFGVNDEPNSVDVHPLTFNVAIGFKEGLKLFTISSEGLKPTTIQFPMKNCSSVRYSKFGHKLIAGSSNQIIIINPYEQKITHSIQLSSGYNVKQLSFLDRDLYIFAEYMNGSCQVMTWQGVKLFEVWKKESKTLCAAYDSIFDVMVCSYNENFIKFYRQRGTQQFGVLWTYPFNVSSILIVNELGTIFMGTSLGKIRAYQWPFTEMMRFSKSFTELQLHDCAIIKMKMVNDFSLLISGGEDGSVFISKINAFSDGIAITDAQVMHSLKPTHKNYTNLFYLQQYMITSSGIEFGQQQSIVQLQSDKADFESQYSQIILCIEQQNQIKLHKQQKQKQTRFQQQLQGRERQIEQLNVKKIGIKQKINQIQKQKVKQQQQLQVQKQNKMRELYKQHDILQQEKQRLQQRFMLQLKQTKSIYNRKYQSARSQWHQQQRQLLTDINAIQTQHNTSIINYQQLIKQEQQQGTIYKNKMLQQLQLQLETEKDNGQRLRKGFNKLKHDNTQLEEKLKTFQQMLTEMQIDTYNNKQRHSQLKQHQTYLTQVLSQKDKLILQEQKQVKQLLSTNINNYTHQQFLKYKQQQLVQKTQFLQQQILQLQQKYNNFQNDFVNLTLQSNSIKDSIQAAQQMLNQCKEKQKLKQQSLYMLNYNFNLLIDQTLQAWTQSKAQKQLFSKTVEKLFASQGQNDFIKEQKSMNSTAKDNSIKTKTRSPSPRLNSSPSAPSLFLSSPFPTPQEKIQKRDHLIKQVVNTNKLRKIDDNIRRTIMIKLNRQTVSLTCEVNELRKEKKKLATKINQLKHYIEQLGGNEGDLTSKEYGSNKGLRKYSPHSQSQQIMMNRSVNSDSVMDDDIVPANISIIRSKPSKHLPTVSSRQKLLPFQVYHNKKSKQSLHSRLYAKGDFDQSSTQLPSLLPSIIKGGSILEDGSGLFSVGEIIGSEKDIN